jgi:[ribosomal protein S5]-alanine N-acetyltransferase
MEILRTARMTFRQFCHEDFESLYTLDSNPEVMKYISDGVPMKEEQVKSALTRIINRYEEWTHYGIWAATISETNEFIGWFAFKPLPKINEIEVGYRLLPKYWGKGLATEGTVALLNYGFEDLKLEKITAIALPENKASRKVLEKTGFTYTGLTSDPFRSDKESRDVSFYELRRESYNQQLLKD